MRVGGGRGGRRSSILYNLLQMIQDESFAFLIIECRRNMFGIAANLTKVAQNSLKQWMTELTAGNQVFQGEVCIKRGIFQGDSLSPLLFILTLILLTLVLRKVKAGYNLWNGLPTIIHPLFMDDLKLFGKSENWLDIHVLIQSVRVVEVKTSEWNLE